MIRTTYFAALNTGRVTPGHEDHVYGVVRRVNDGLEDAIDRNFTALAPSDQLLTQTKRIADATDPATAWAKTNFEQRYREQIRSSDYATKAIGKVIADARDGVGDVYLVCYEASEAHCHRRLLRHIIRQRAPGLVPGGDRRHACEDGHHDLQGRLGLEECLRCGLSSQSIVDDLGHSISMEGEA